MAERYYKVSLGGSIPTDVTEAGSDSSAYACFRVTYDATGNQKLQTLRALDAIKSYITRDSWPPA